jgi:hypothetical protein
MKRILFLFALSSAILFLLFIIITNASMEGKIINVTWPSKNIYSLHESVPFRVIIQNTGTKCSSFWVGYSVQDRYGHNWVEPEVAQQTASICPGNHSSVGLSWDPRNDVYGGKYSAEIRLWRSVNGDTPMDKLDSISKSDAFLLNYSGFKVDMVKPGFKESIIKLNFSSC